MKVVRVKAKVVSPKLYTQEDMDSMSAELASCRDQIMGLKQKNAQLEADFDIEKRNHALAIAGVQLWQKEAEDITKAYRKEIGAAEYWKEQYERSQKEGGKSVSQLAEMLIKANDERDAAISKAADLNLELMERGVRIEELERRIEWLQAHSNTEAEFVS